MAKPFNLRRKIGEQPESPGTHLGFRDFGDTYAGPLVAARLQALSGYDENGVAIYTDLLVDTQGRLSLAPSMADELADLLIELRRIRLGLELSLGEEFGDTLELADVNDS